jgi:HK97 family phage prohead protease
MTTKRYALARVKATGDGESGNGTFSAILSTSNLDRDGEEIKSGAFTARGELPARIPIDIDHGMSVASTIGSAVPSYNANGELQVDGEYAGTALGQEVRQLVNEGHISTMSVAYMAPEYDKEQKNLVVSAELLNGSFVAIPSNREATVLSSKALASMVEKIGARNNASDKERIQAIHDHAIALGAKAAPADDELGDSEDDAEPAGDDAAETAESAKRATLAHRKAVRASAAKAVAGSYEQRQQAICDALDAIYVTDWEADNWEYAYPTSTFDGTVVFRVGGTTENRGTWQADYTMAADGTVQIGTPSRVTLVEQIIPVDTDTVSSSEAPTGADGATQSTTEPAAVEVHSAAADSAEAKRLAYRRRNRSRADAMAAAGR